MSSRNNYWLAVKQRCYNNTCRKFEQTSQITEQCRKNIGHVWYAKDCRHHVYIFIYKLFIVAEGLFIFIYIHVTYFIQNWIVSIKYEFQNLQDSLKQIVFCDSCVACTPRTIVSKNMLLQCPSILSIQSIFFLLSNCLID